MAELYRRHAGAVYGLARKVLRDDRLAEEVTQEVFLRLWREPERFDPERGSMRSYLLTITHGKAVDELRSEMSRRAREDRVAAEEGGQVQFDHEVADMLLTQRVRDAISALPVAEQRAVELAYYGGHTYREVAEITGEPEGTTKSRIRSAMRRLHAELSPTEVEGS